MPSEAETRINRAITSAFIAYEPFTVILSHAQSVSTASGGYVYGVPMQRAAQTARQLLGADARPVRRLVDGEEAEANYTLVMAWDADVERGDWYYLNGLKYEVLWVVRVGGYETKAEVTLRG